MIEAELSYRANPDGWRDCVTAVEAVLAAYKRRSASGQPDWSGKHFPAFAARTCINHGDFARAKGLVALGLEVEPGSQILHYLDRIAERGQSMALK